MADQQVQIAQLTQLVEALAQGNNGGNRTLRERTTPNLTQQPQAVVLPPLACGVKLEQKSGVINLLATFHDLPEEDPIMHLNQFHGIFMTTKQGNVIEE